jgi:hypothetical protein
MSTTPMDFKETKTECSMSRKRQLVALEATWEIEKLCGLLRTCVQPNDRMEEFAVRGLSARIQELNSILMGALGDGGETTKNLMYRLRLKHEEEEPV